MRFFSVRRQRSILPYRVLSSFLAHAEAARWVAAHRLPRKGAALLAPASPRPCPPASAR
jgi:hypothetical protein